MRTLLLAMFMFFKITKIPRGDCFAQCDPHMRLAHRSLATEYGFRPPDCSAHDFWTVRYTSVTVVVPGSGLNGLAESNHFLGLDVIDIPSQRTWNLQWLE